MEITSSRMLRSIKLWGRTEEHPRSRRLIRRTMTAGKELRLPHSRSRVGTTILRFLIKTWFFPQSHYRQASSSLSFVIRQEYSGMSKGSRKVQERVTEIGNCRTSRVHQDCRCHRYCCIPRRENSAIAEDSPAMPRRFELCGYVRRLRILSTHAAYFEFSLKLLIRARLAWCRCVVASEFGAEQQPCARRRP